MATQSRQSLPLLSRGTLLFLLAVILWGSFVRASGSGAGCGAHWPLCNGVVIPESASWKTLVEFTHRLTSGLSLLLCAGICFVSFREFPKGSLARKGGIATLILILTEAIIGAGLVLFKLVESDQSMLRAISMSIHLLNTFLLLGAVVLTAQWASKREPRWCSPQGKDRVLTGVALVVVMGLGASGAVTALGDTLFPSQTLAQGLAQDFSPTQHLLTGLRIYHPLLAIAIGTYLALFARRAMHRAKAEGRPAIAYYATLVLGLLCAQILIGFVNVLLLAPIAVQMLHLLIADLLWLSLIAMIGEMFTAEGPV